MTHFSDDYEWSVKVPAPESYWTPWTVVTIAGVVVLWSILVFLILEALS